MIAYLGKLVRQARVNWGAAFQRDTESSVSRQSCLLRVVALVLVIGVTALIGFNEERMETIAAFGYGGALLVMLLSNATLVLPAPGLVFIFALGSTLNPIGVGFFAAIGATLGEITGYAAGYSGLGVLEDTPLANRVKQWMTRNGTLTIFALSTIPNPVFDIAGILSGTGRVPIRKFLGITFLGKLTQCTAIAVAGSMSLGWVHDLFT